MTALYREIVEPLTEQQEYLLLTGAWIPRKPRVVRARPDERSEPIPLLTRLDKDGNIEHLYDEPCGCRYTRSLGTPKFTMRCGKGRECVFRET